MTITELVKQLDEQRQLHGDLEVYSEADYAFVRIVRLEEQDGRMVVVLEG